MPRAIAATAAGFCYARRRLGHDASPFELDALALVARVVSCPPMARRLFSTLSLLATVLLAALAALWLGLWIASYWRSPRLSFGYVSGARGTGLDSRTTPGALECVGTRGDGVPPQVPKGFRRGGPSGGSRSRTWTGSRLGCGPGSGRTG